MDLTEIKNDPTFTDEGRQACSLFRLHILKMQRKWTRSTPASDLEEIGRRAIIYSEVIDALENLMEPTLKEKPVVRRRLHNKNHQ